MASSNYIRKHTNIDDAILHLAKGCKNHPLVCEFVIEQLKELENKGKLCLTPSTIFEIFHHKLKGVA